MRCDAATRPVAASLGHCGRLPVVWENRDSRFHIEPCLVSCPASPELEAPDSSEAPWLVACFCAEWCGTCREYRAGFDALAARLRDTWFRWIDIEDEAALAEDFEVENFPTLLIQRGTSVLFYGPVLPQIGIVERQLAALREATVSRPVDDVPDLRSRLTDVAAGSAC